MREVGNRFGREIREGRTRAGLTLREAARQAGISAPYLCDIERGNRRPALGVLSKLASILGLDSDLLVDRYIGDWLQQHEAGRAYLSRHPESSRG